MPDMSREQLIDLVTREVLRALGGNPLEQEVDRSSLPQILVIGCPDLLPKNIRDRYNPVALDAYTCPGDIEHFEKVYITELTVLELADIALGRPTHSVQCAVISALLCGKEICLMESALPHRKLSAKASRGFYQLLEGYVRTLQHFGISLVTAQSPIDKYVAHGAAGTDLPDGVITEAIARDIVGKKSEAVLYFRRGTVFTPSARDVFLHAGKTLETV